MDKTLFAISGATGQTGSVVAQTLLSAGHPVRLLVRDPGKAAQWKEQGAQVVETDFTDHASLAQGLSGASAAYFMSPPDYHSADMFASTKKHCDVWRRAVEQSGLTRMVALSSVGAHLSANTGNIYTTYLTEHALSGFPAEVHFVRAAWFMENWAGVLPVAKQEGTLPSFLAPLDRSIPMVSVNDIGRVCAETLMAGSKAPRYTELQGPQSYSPLDVAQTLSKILQREVAAVAVPEDDWIEIFTSWGFSVHAAGTWAEMVRGFNSGHIVFEDQNVRSVSGNVTLEQALRKLLDKQ